jgi:four helix bundle protein
MAAARRFEDLLVWQSARNLCREVYSATFHPRFTGDFALKDQVRRAAISIMLNIAEGFARQTNNEFRQFLYIAHGSSAEVQCALYIALDQHYIDQNHFEQLYRSADDISRMPAGLIRHLDDRRAH